MKKSVFIVLFILTIVSCKKNSNDNPNNSDLIKSQIIGKWTQTKDVYSVSEKDGTISIVDTSFEKGFYVQFNSDFTGLLSQGSVDNFKYTTDSRNVTFNFYENSEALPLVVPIKNLTKNALELNFILFDKTDGHSEIHDTFYTR